MHFKIKPESKATRKGGMLPVLSVVMIVVIIAVATGIDIARKQLTRSEMRTANDAAARAAVVEVRNSQNTDAAKDAAILLASKNHVAGRGFALTRDQIEIETEAHTSNGELTLSAAVDSSAAQLTSVRIAVPPSATSVEGEVYQSDFFHTDPTLFSTQPRRDVTPNTMPDQTQPLKQ